MSVAALSRDDLEERLAYAEREIGLSQRTTEKGALCKALSLNRQQATLLMALYRANGRILSRDQLMDAIDTKTDNQRLVGVLVSQIRGKIDFGAIGASWGLGYNITPAGKAVVGKALEGVGA